MALDMLHDPLTEKLARGETAIGLSLMDVYTIELAAHMGFDWFFLDQMFTPHDWSETDRLIRAGWAAGITPVVRVQSYPWLGYDRRVAVEVSRAAGIGAHYILVSNSGKREIEECVQVTHDWHRKALWVHPFSSFDEWGPGIEQMKGRTNVIPQPETQEGLDDLLECLDLPEIRMVFIAMTDASRIFSDTPAPNWYSERLWSFVDDTVAKANSLGKVVGAATSFAYDLDEVKKRVVKLQEHGVRMICLPGLYALFQVGLGGFLTEVKEQLRESASG